MITILTIQFSVIAWTLAIAFSWKKQGSHSLWFRVAAFIVFCLHIVAAFTEYYQWSHQIAHHETARQTRELFGIETGVGLYVNYIFAACLLIDLTARFRANLKFAKWIDGFIIFMIFNGAIVFGGFYSRLIGGLCLLYLLAVYLSRNR